MRLRYPQSRGSSAASGPRPCCLPGVSFYIVYLLDYDYAHGPMAPAHRTYALPEIQRKDKRQRNNDIYAQSMRTQHITWDQIPKSGAGRLLPYWRARPLHLRAPPAHRAHVFAEVEITMRDNQHNISAECTRTRHIATDKVPISGPGRGLP